jgi:cytochrome d ubiquinol oxidase subunit II
VNLATAWYVLVGAMLAAYVVLDGFDFGAGILHLVVARDDGERRSVLRAIGPVWDGNEVWLLATGGSIFLAFPRLLATSFSGFYLPLIIVVWLLLFRALGIELRHQVDHPLWTQFWDVAFAGASLLLAVFFGAALGNVVRGVSIDASGRFFAPLWTNFRVGEATGILDWYTILVAVTVTATVAMHGGLWLAWRTAGAVRERADRIVDRLWLAVLALAIVTMATTLWVQPQVLHNVSAHPWGAVFPLTALASLLAVRGALHRSARRNAFLASAGYLVGMLASAAFGVYPMLLPARDAARSLTIENSAAAPYGLAVALYWWIPGMILALAYFYFLYSRLPVTVAARDGIAASGAMPSELGGQRHGR